MHRSRAVFAALLALASLASAAEAVKPPSNIRMHDPSGDPPGQAQTIPVMAGLIADLLAGWISFPVFGLIPTLAYSVSFNDGASFTDGGSPPAPTGYTWRASPAVVVDERKGDFYYFGLMTASGPNRARIGVARGSFIFSPPSFNWATPVPVSSDFVSNTVYMNTLAAAADSGNVYVLYPNYYSDPGNIELYRSTDRGVSWSGPVRLSPPPGANLFTFSPEIAIGPGGEVYAAWAVDNVKTADVLVRKSVDHGATFGPAFSGLQVVQNGISVPGVAAQGLSEFSLAVDRTNGLHHGRCYLVGKSAYNFFDDPPLPTGPARLEVEPNDTTTQATPIQVGDVIRGNSSSAPPSAEDVDHYAVTLHAGDRFIVWPDSVQANQEYTLVMVSPRGGDDQLFTNEQISDSLGYGGLPVTFTAPVDGIYDLAFAPEKVTGRYRLLTGYGIAGAEPGRDQYDIVASYSDGGLTWSAPVLVNHDPIGFDNAIPGVLVAPDGLPYVSWSDCRDDLYGTHTNIYVGRSPDGGATWEPEQRITTASSYWSVALNPQFGPGAHTALASDGTYLHVGWADARVPTPNLYTALVIVGFNLSQCPPADTSAVPGEILSLGFQISNQSDLFDQPYVVDFTSDRGWSLPSVETEIVPALSNGFPVTAAFQVPDTAAVGTTTLTLHCRNLGGTKSVACPVTLHIVNGLVSAGAAPLAFRLGPVSPNPCSGPAAISFVLPRPGKARLQLFSADGRLVRTLVDAERPAGAGAAFWDGRDAGGRRAAAGVYFLDLEAGGEKLVRRLAVVPR
jgi:hypothetical protein